MTHPVFGVHEENVEYVTRYGVYAVIPDEKKENIILVQAPNGAWFLPGGQMEEGEDQLAALERELLEELGFSIQVGDYFGQADEYIYEALSYQEVEKPLEDFNNLAWFPVDLAIEKLKRGSHKWGIEQWKRKYQNN